METETLFSRLTGYIFGTMSSIEAIKIILKYLHEEIQFSGAFLLDQYRQDKVSRIIFQYFPYSYSMTPVIQKNTSVYSDAMLNRLRSTTPYKHVVLIDDITTDSEVYERSIQFTPSMASACALWFSSDMEFKRMQCLIFFSHEKHFFRDEHVEMLNAVYSILKKVCCDILDTSVTATQIMNAVEGNPDSDSLLRACPGMSGVYQKICRLDRLEPTVLIMGASGVGKELAADVIHSRSKRRDAPFLKVNCGAIPEDLVDSTFFGAEKGAYTGAYAQQKGYFEQANKGTLFLDEVGELTLAAQVRLLRVLEHHEIIRVGGSRRVPVDVRILAATNRDIWSMVSEGMFREDLAYRLNVVALKIPPLCERPEDIHVLARYFYSEFIKGMKLANPPLLTEGFIDKLAQGAWPGNVRQLRSVIERTLIWCEGKRYMTLEEEDERLIGRRHGGAEEKQDEMLKGTVRHYKKKFEGSRAELKACIEKALEQAGGRIQGKGGAAEILGESPSTVRFRMKSLGVPLPKERKGGK